MSKTKNIPLITVFLMRKKSISQTYCKYLHKGLNKVLKQP